MLMAEADVKFAENQALTLEVDAKDKLTKEQTKKIEDLEQEKKETAAAFAAQVEQLKINSAKAIKKWMKDHSDLKDLDNQKAEKI